MPGMNGRDLALRLAAQRPRLKRLFMSGYTADVISPQGILEDGLSFIQKPFAVSELLRMVRSLLSPEGQE
jgi:FixJ family two-component response regulator